MATLRHFLTIISFALALLALCVVQVVSTANIVNDVNNMLRDARSITEKEVNGDGSRHIGNSHRKRATSVQRAEAQQQQQQLLRNMQMNDEIVDDDDNDNDVTEQSSVELLRFVDDDNNIAAEVTKTTTTTTNKVNTNPINNDNDNDDAANLSLNDQVRLLTKQLNALMTRRREDYELLEHNLRKSLRITTDAATVDADIRSELEQLRHEVKTLREGHINNNNNNKERLTVEWLQQSVAEIRKQLVELQQVASNVAKDMHTRTQGYEDLATVRNDFQEIKLELVALKERQDKNEVYVQELREELLQQEEDLRRRLLHKSNNNKNNNKVELAASATATAVDSSFNSSSSEGIELSTESLADHNRRHTRFQHQQIHELQLAQRSLRRQLNELKYHRIGERVRSIEIEQHRIANANFNLSRQIASLDKLHTSMLELLEDVEELQNKVDKSIPDLRHEISKLEFANAQNSAEQNLLREEGKNAARTLQAMAVSVSALQDERDGVKKMEANVELLRTNVDRLQSLLESELSKRKLMHDKANLHAAKRSHKHAHHQQQQQEQKQQQQEQQQQQQAAAYGINDELARAETLVAELENVETQYESIVEKLPHDCSDLSSNSEGLHLIAPAGQHRPLMTHCTADGWTTVQRRFDGSADFNRSWVDYAQGFGAPAGEYWIGNEQLHHLTFNNCTQLRVVMQDIYDNVWIADYGYFYISSRDDGYRLHIGDYSGNASDALNYQQDMQFSAIDDDRDISQTHCAANYEGGWWFSHCQHANLNGRYNLGLTWFDASRNEWIAVKSSQMMIKRQAAATCAFVAARQQQAASNGVGLRIATATATQKLTATAATTTTETLATTITTNSMSRTTQNVA